jgi:N-acetylneuraminic acid mutarotase
VDAEGLLKKDLWEYDASTNRWKRKADLPGVEGFMAVGIAIAGKGYIGTGYYSNKGEAGPGNYLSDFWEYDPAINCWKAVKQFPGAARYGAAAFSISGKGYVGNGSLYRGYGFDFWSYDPGTEKWSKGGRLPWQLRCWFFHWKHGLHSWR